MALRKSKRLTEKYSFESEKVKGLETGSFQKRGAVRKPKPLMWKGQIRREFPTNIASMKLD